MRDAGPIVLKLVHCHNTLRKTARAGDFFSPLTSTLTVWYRESHMWHFAQGTHLQMKHLGESPEFSWGSSSIDSSQVRGWFAKHSPVPFNGSKILLAEPQVRDARSTMGCNTSVAWWGSKFLLTRGKKKKPPKHSGPNYLNIH